MSWNNRVVLFAVSEPTLNSWIDGLGIAGRGEHGLLHALRGSCGKSSRLLPLLTADISFPRAALFLSCRSAWVRQKQSPTSHSYLRFQDRTQHPVSTRATQINLIDIGCEQSSVPFIHRQVKQLSAGSCGTHFTLVQHLYSTATC